MSEKKYRPNMNLALKLLPLLMVALPAAALESDFQQKVEIDADQQRVDLKTDEVIFIGNVVATQGSIRIEADTLTIKGDGQRKARLMIAEGEPATFYQLMDNGKPLDAEASTFHYQLQDKNLLLMGNAVVKQEDSEVRSARISYQIDEQKMVADMDGESPERVKTIFLPEQLDDE